MDVDKASSTSSASVSVTVCEDDFSTPVRAPVVGQVAVVQPRRNDINAIEAIRRHREREFTEIAAASALVEELRGDIAAVRERLARGQTAVKELDAVETRALRIDEELAREIALVTEKQKAIVDVSRASVSLARLHIRLHASSFRPCTTVLPKAPVYAMTWRTDYAGWWTQLQQKLAQAERDQCMIYSTPGWKVSAPRCPNLRRIPDGRLVATFACCTRCLWRWRLRCSSTAW